MPNLNAIEKDLTSKEIRLSLINLESNTKQFWTFWFYTSHEGKF